MKKILVTGANGMLGQDLCPILRNEGFEVVETDINNLDITNLSEVEFVLNREKPDIVIHCAAFTNVDKAEEDIETARLINSTGTENLAKVTNKINATLVYISTDYVFDGKKNEPYTPKDETSPLNNYGLTKLEGEKAVIKYNSKHYICRTSWLYGLYGKNFVETMISLAGKKDKLKVVDDQIGCPTWTVALSNAILKIINKKPYGFYHTCGGGRTSWCGFAKKIFEIADIKVDLQPCATEDFPRPAKRPSFSVMDNDGICPDWEVSLKEYFNKRVMTNEK